MNGHILRVRAMRCWYGAGGSGLPDAGGFSAQFTPTDTDSLGFDPRRNGGASILQETTTSITTALTRHSFGFENRSDSIPQPITLILADASCSPLRGRHRHHCLSRSRMQKECAGGGGRLSLRQRNGDLQRPDLLPSFRWSQATGRCPRLSPPGLRASARLKDGRRPPPTFSLTRASGRQAKPVSTHRRL